MEYILWYREQRGYLIDKQEFNIVIGYSFNFISP